MAVPLKYAACLLIQWPNDLEPVLIHAQGKAALLEHE